MSHRLPIGIQEFRTIREQGFHYVDKTPRVRKLTDEGRFCFLSRPRRFGKSLLLDTLGSLFEGCEKRLHAHARDFGISLERCRARSCSWRFDASVGQVSPGVRP